MNNEINYVSPFKRFCITVGNLPTAYLESMSYYEGLTYLVNYLSNNVIPALNNNGKVVEELQEQFTILKNYVDNYFENLDVQEEINNKLDEMAESGQLTDIIAQYLSLAGMFTFNTVNDMKNAENLINGSKCCTLGFNSINDGGKATYQIRTITNEDIIDEKTKIALYDNTLIAELIMGNIINFEMLGAIGDGITNDTSTLQIAMNLNKKIICNPNKSYLINSDITISNNLDIDLVNSTILSTNGNNIEMVLNAKKITIKNGTLNNVAIIDNSEEENIYYIENCTIKDTSVNGIRLEDINEIYVNNCNFNNIGTGTININNQGCGIRVNTSNYAEIKNSKFENCHGTGACIIRNTKYMLIDNNVFDNNDYRAIVPADDESPGNDPLFKTKGFISNNKINNCGVNASHNTGVGCNGIYSNCNGDISELVVSNNIITNVCENGIEGQFGIVENNYVDGTGVDQVNHPTPSASGINMYGGIYRYNIVKNSYLQGLYVSGNHASASTILANKKIYGNNIGKSVNKPTEAIFLNGTEYNNIEIYDNIIDGSIRIGNAGKYKNCVIGNNFNLQGNPFYNSNSGTYLIDKGNITLNGFAISGTTISNITTASCGYVIGEDDVTFTSTGTSGAFSFTVNCSKNSISVLKLITNDDTAEIKCTIQATKEDDTVTTVASNRLLQVTNNQTGIFMSNENLYKNFKFLITVGTSGTTLKLKNIQVKEVTY